MTVILAILSAWARPALVPVTGADVARALQIEQRLITAAALPSPQAMPKELAPGVVVVGYEPGHLRDAESWIEAESGRVVRVDEAGGFVVAWFEEALSARARGTPGLRYLEADPMMHASHIPDDPLFLTEQWGKWLMYADRAWDITTGSFGIKVAVCDNGVDYTHPDLAQRFVPGERGYDFVMDDADPKPDNTSISEAFHGTHVSGIIAATLDNGTGVAGWAGIQLMAVKVLNDSGSGNMSDLASGINWAVDHGARVISMSLGADSKSTPVADACRRAAERGVVLVAAAGNQGAPQVQYPGRHEECVCVGALAKHGELASYSNYGPEQDVVAPGSEILSTHPGGSYSYSSGTSMATPQVSGVAALVLSVNPDLSGNRTRAILLGSGVDMGLPGTDNQYGYGLVNAYRAVGLAERLTGGDLPSSPGEGVHAASIRRGTIRIPAWGDRAEVFDGSGRLVARWQSGAEHALSVEPGSYFVRVEAGARRELHKTLVLW